MALTSPPSVLKVGHPVHIHTIYIHQRSEDVVHIKKFRAYLRLPCILLFSHALAVKELNHLVRFHQKLFGWGSSRMLQGGCLSQRV